MDLYGQLQKRNTDLLERCRELEKQVEELRGMHLGDFITKKFQWSLRSFGDGARTKGLCEHIRKELAEIEAKPYDLEEWIDVMILATDGFCRAGGDPDMLVPLMKRKHEKNLTRSWPTPNGEDHPVEHDRTRE